MYKAVKFLFLLSISLIPFSCANTSNKPVINFSADSTSIVVKNIDDASLFEIKKIIQVNPDSSDLISVVITPGDKDSLQDEKDILGKLVLKGDSLIFKPEQPFLKGKRYIVESYIGAKFANAGKLLKGKIKYNFKPEQQVLVR